MSKKLQILFVPNDVFEQINCAIGIAEVLIKSGHKVIFAINNKWRGRFVKYGIEEIYISNNNCRSNMDPVKYWDHIVVNGGVLKTMTTLEKYIHNRMKIYPNFIEEMKILDQMIEKLLQTIRPNIIVLDVAICIPSVVRCGIPWVLMACCNPLYFINDDRTPPPCSGLSAVGPKSEWKFFRDTINVSSYDLWKNFNDYVVSRGVQPLPMSKFFTDSPFLNIYGFPYELDYIDMRPLPPNWYRFDVLKCMGKTTRFELPEYLRQKPGKLVYISLGLLGAADLELMQKLVAILSKSQHRFIVSKGPHHKLYELSDNMWGQRLVPKLFVLPIVDLVITHGGIDVVNECFYYGKPMIVMPLIADDFDNAQRVHEKSFGIRLNTYDFTESDLLLGIERLLSDRLLNERLENISKRIQSENSISLLPDLFRSIVSSVNKRKLSADYFTQFNTRFDF